MKALRSTAVHMDYIRFFTECVLPLRTGIRGMSDERRRTLLSGMRERVEQLREWRHAAMARRDRERTEGHDGTEVSGKQA